MVRPSLLWRLLAWPFGTLVVVWAVFEGLGFLTGVREADELTDGHLASVASLMAAQRVGEFSSAPSAAALAAHPELKAHDYQESLSVVAWDAQGRVVARIGEAPTPEFTTAEGFHTLWLGQPKSQWRAFSHWTQPGHDTKITVLLKVSERDALAHDIAAQVAAPGFWAVLVIALAVALAARQGMRPFENLSQQIRTHDIRDGTRLADPRHEEFIAIVDSINSLITRYEATLQRERRVAGDVADEVRALLSAQGLIASSPHGATSPSEREEALRQLEQALARADHLLAHLLLCVRAGRSETQLAARPQRVADHAPESTLLP